MVLIKKADDVSPHHPQKRSFPASLYFYKSAVYLRNLPLSLFTAYTAKPFYPQKSHIQSLYSKYLLLPLLLTVLQVDVHEHWL
jgi:hypothetical protein